MYSLIVTAKMNDIDPQAWLADVLSGIANYPTHKIEDLLPWNWTKAEVTQLSVQAAWMVTAQTKNAGKHSLGCVRS